LEEGEEETIAKALALFTQVEYLLELQEFKLPRSADRAAELERYLSRSLDYWGVSRDDGVTSALARAKTSIRAAFDRLMTARAE
jgi:hypothetical protein